MRWRFMTRSCTVRWPRRGPRVQAHRRWTAGRFHQHGGTTSDVVRAAVAELAAAEWGPTGPLRIRSSLDAGTASSRDGDFFGPPVNRVARINSIVHPDQVVISPARPGADAGAVRSRPRRAPAPGPERAGAALAARRRRASAAGDIDPRPPQPSLDANGVHRPPRRSRGAAHAVGPASAGDDRRCGRWRQDPPGRRDGLGVHRSLPGRRLVRRSDARTRWRHRFRVLGVIGDSTPLRKHRLAWSDVSGRCRGGSAATRANLVRRRSR